MRNEESIVVIIGRLAVDSPQRYIYHKFYSGISELSPVLQMGPAVNYFVLRFHLFSAILFARISPKLFVLLATRILVGLTTVGTHRLTILIK